MDDAGIDKAVLAMTSPGVQPLLDDEQAKGIARRGNDILKAACETYPDRFHGMIAVAPQDAAFSVEELKRGKEELGFHGVQINSHTKGHYLDEERFDPILRACADLDLPLYIHPQGPPDGMIGGMVEAGLDGAIFGFGVETSLSRDAADDDRGVRPLSVAPADARPWLRRPAVHGSTGSTTCTRPASARSATNGSSRCSTTCSTTCATMSWRPTAACRSAPRSRLMIEVMGEDRVMYAMDYPYQYLPEEVAMMDDLDITDAQKKKFFQTNAERWFKL